MNEDTTPIITEQNGRNKNGRFTTGNNGKPKGAVNKSTKDVKEFITNFLNDKAFEIPLIWDTLEDKDKASLFIHLSKLVLPRPIDEKEERPLITRFEFDFSDNDTKQIY
ncbi:MAG: hypothetical protein FGM14_12650 [Flavobacteriales bacterium]|nr:hypothetical protein [Flavobacteriales bacterium]